MKRLLLACACLWAAGTAARAAEVTTVGDFRFLGGQYFFKNSPSSLSGNLSFTVVPSVKFSDSFSLIPTYNGTYRGTEEVADLAGGGTLFQDALDHFLSLKGVYTVLPSLRLKAGASYRLEYLRETKDETWGKGLFDYQKADGSLEAEYTYRRDGSVRVGVDYYTVTFPNYQTLESQQTQELGRELAGKNTLNSVNRMVLVTLNNSFGRLMTQLGANFTSRSYPDQPVVLSNGGFSPDKRADVFTAGNAGVSYPFVITRDVRCIASLDYQLFMNDSTQANYEVKNPLSPKFTPDYYDYTASACGPAFNLLLGKRPWVLSLAATATRRDYKTRLVQDAAGAYAAAEKIYVNETAYSVGIVYPLTEAVKLRMIFSYLDSQSNMKYEKTFAYNYQSSNYLTGFSYEF